MKPSGDVIMRNGAGKCQVVKEAAQDEETAEARAQAIPLRNPQAARQQDRNVHREQNVLHTVMTAAKVLIRLAAVIGTTEKTDSVSRIQTYSSAETR